MSEISIVKKVRVKYINHQTLIHDQTFEYLPHFIFVDVHFESDLNNYECTM